MRTAQPSAVRSIPVEIWDLVRHKVTDLELRAAECEFLETRACDYCWQTFGRDCSVRPVFKWADLLQCNTCDKKISSWEGFDGNPTLTKVGPAGYTCADRD